MGRQRILNYYKKKGRISIALGLPMAVACFFMLKSFFEDDVEISYVMLIGPMFLIFVFALLFGIYLVLNPGKQAKKFGNDKILDMADELYDDLQYDDGYIKLSENIIATDWKRPQLAYRWDVYLITDHMIPGSKYTSDNYFYVLYTRNDRNSLFVNINHLSKEERKKLLRTLLESCPNAVYDKLKGPGGKRLYELRHMDVHDIPNSPFYAGDDRRYKNDVFSDSYTYMM